MFFCKRMILVGSTLMLLLLGFAANAGNLLLTGHDMDLHCSGGSGCSNFGVALNYVRQGAPTKTLPMLVLDEGTQVQLGTAQPVAAAKNAVEGAGVPFPVVVVKPSSAAFATMPITVALYSAVVIASDSSCGGCDNSTASITAINARTSDIQAFFTAGGGLMYLAGASNRATYYNSIPIPATATAVSAPFTITPAGTTLGLVAADANCCATHNSFSTPGAGSPLVVVETDSAGLAETLIVTGGTVGGGVIIVGPPGPIPPTLAVPTVSEWALGIMVLMLTLFGVYSVRRRV